MDDIPTTAAMGATNDAEANEEAASIPVAPTSRIGVRIEPLVPAILFSNRHDFLIRGSIHSATPVEEIALVYDGLRVGQISFGNADRSAAALPIDGVIGHRQNFVFNLPVTQARDLTHSDFTIIAGTFDDDTADVAFVLERYQDNSNRGRVVSGPVTSDAWADALPPPTIIYTEHAGIDPEGTLTVHGWAVSRSPLVTVQVFVDDERIGSAILGTTREDVAIAHPGYPNARSSGFSLTQQIGALADRARSVRTQAIVVTGTSQDTMLPIERLPRGGGVSAPVQVLAPPSIVAAQEATSVEATIDAPRVIALYCDNISLTTDGILRVVGWVVCAAGVAAVGVVLDGVPVGDAVLGLSRPDVGEAYPAIPAARFAGFVLEAKALDDAAGEHVCTVVARNGFDDVEIRRQSLVVTNVERQSAPTGPAIGQLDSAFKFQLDSPPVVDGVVRHPVSGRLILEGWVLGREGIDGIAVMLDGQLLGAAHYGQARQDVAAAHPEWPDALRSGFAFHCPQRSLHDGQHTMSVRVLGKGGDQLDHTFGFTVAKAVDSEERPAIRRRIAGGEAALYADMLRRLDWQPKFRILLREADAAAPATLARTLVSLESQVYPHWHVDFLADDAALRGAVATIVAAHRMVPGRIGFLDVAALSVDFAVDTDDGGATLVGVLACGDELGCDALAEFAVQSGMRRGAELFYADEVRDDPATGDREAFFKPAFSPDLLLTTNYIGRPCFAAATLLGRTGASPQSLLALGDYDLLLRCVEHVGPDGVHSIARLLCERAPGSAEHTVPVEGLPEQRSGGQSKVGQGESGLRGVEQRALAAAAARRGVAATVEPGCLPGIWRLRRRVVTQGKVSIIIPTCAAHGHIRTCLATLKAHTAYRNVEVIAIDNIPDSMAAEKTWLREAADRCVDIPEAFNWSRFNNLAAAVADGDFLLFLNDDIEVTQDDWLDAMLEHAQRPEVGIVGPQLLYPDGKVQHAGMFLAGLGLARHAFRFSAADEPGYFGLARSQRNVMAVTGACMLMRRETFDALGGFDEAHEVINNDLDFCLRAHEAGLLTVYTPYASLIHHELASRASMKEAYNLDHFESRWRMCFAAGDPFHNPSLSKNYDDFRPNDEPVRSVFSGHPQFDADAIRRILVVKVDHIGDFLTAVPAIRRLKEHFPRARITVLASGSVRSLAALDPSIDEIIDFNFFHAKSALGQRELHAAELAVLTARLAPYGFDLAIDLRKHLDTRELLRCSGAPVMAGFDHLGQFPWLDVSLEWEGDQRMHAKRYHVTDDLLHLVDAVATAGQPDRTGIRADAVARLCETADIPAAIQDFLAEPVVCVHAGAGNEMKQWPVGFFATLIDMLISRNRMRVLLIGGPDEIEIEQQVLSSIENPDQVMSVVGRLNLDVLPAVIAGCSLYVGNDSGPKHIAASVGVPTIGVHSGTVDPIEWAPMGPRAVAVARAMSCSPCYLNRLDDCARGLTCLRELEPLAVHRMCEMMLAHQVPIAGRIAPAHLPAINADAPADPSLDEAPAPTTLKMRVGGSGD